MKKRYKDKKDTSKKEDQVTNRLTNSLNAYLTDLSIAQLTRGPPHLLTGIVSNVPINRLTQCLTHKLSDYLETEPRASKLLIPNTITGYDLSPILSPSFQPTRISFRFTLILFFHLPRKFCVHFVFPTEL